MICSECGEKIIITRVGRIFPYAHYDIYHECPNRCKGVFHIQIEGPDEELMNKSRVSTRRTPE